MYTLPEIEQISTPPAHKRKRSPPATASPDLQSPQFSTDDPAVDVFNRIFQFRCPPILMRSPRWADIIERMVTEICRETIVSIFSPVFSCTAMNPRVLQSYLKATLCTSPSLKDGDVEVLGPIECKSLYRIVPPSFGHVPQTYVTVECFSLNRSSDSDEYEEDDAQWLCNADFFEWIWKLWSYVTGQRLIPVAPTLAQQRLGIATFGQKKEATETETVTSWTYQIMQSDCSISALFAIKMMHKFLIKNHDIAAILVSRSDFTGTHLQNCALCKTIRSLDLEFLKRQRFYDTMDRNVNISKTMLYKSLGQSFKHAKQKTLLLNQSIGQSDGVFAKEQSKFSFEDLSEVTLNPILPLGTTLEKEMSNFCFMTLANVDSSLRLRNIFYHISKMSLERRNELFTNVRFSPVYPIGKIRFELECIREMGQAVSKNRSMTLDNEDFRDLNEFKFLGRDESGARQFRLEWDDALALEVLSEFVISFQKMEKLGMRSSLIRHSNCQSAINKHFSEHLIKRTIVDPMKNEKKIQNKYKWQGDQKIRKKQNSATKILKKYEIWETALAEYPLMEWIFEIQLELNSKVPSSQEILRHKVQFINDHSFWSHLLSSRTYYEIQKKWPSYLFDIRKLNGGFIVHPTAFDAIHFMITTQTKAQSSDLQFRTISDQTIPPLCLDHLLKQLPQDGKDQVRQHEYLFDSLTDNSESLNVSHSIPSLSQKYVSNYVSSTNKEVPYLFWRIEKEQRHSHNATSDKNTDSQRKQKISIIAVLPQNLVADIQREEHLINPNLSSAKLASKKLFYGYNMSSVHHELFAHQQNQNVVLLNQRPSNIKSIEELKIAEDSESLVSLWSQLCEKWVRLSQIKFTKRLDTRDS